MGLSLKVGRHGAPVITMPYSRFMRFREAVAQAAGINIWEMQGFCDHGGRSWDTVYDPVAPFLYHSDCEGKLSPRECGEIWPRLAEIAAGLPPEHLADALEIAEGMEMCVAESEPLVFC